MTPLARIARVFLERAGRTSTFNVPAAVGAVVVAVALAACSDAPTATAPAISAAPAIITSGTTVSGLLWSKPVSDAVVTKVIGSAGGSLSIPNGIKLTVPAGAVSAATTFKIVRIPGIIVAYDFQPHGTFAAPLTIEHPTLGTNLFKMPAVTGIEGAYFPDATSLNQTLGTAVVSEFQPTFVSADKAWVKFTVRHFSGYMVSSGRR